MTRAAAPLAVLAFATVAALCLQPSAPAQSGPVRLVDRTLLCRTGAANGARTVDVTARSAVRAGGRLESLAFLVVTTPAQPVPTRPNYLPTLAGVSAGWPPPPPLEAGGLGFSLTRCTLSKARVPLTRRGLRGGPAGVFGQELKCHAPVRVLVRIRATLRSAVRLERTRDRDSLAATARIDLGRIAVRTPGGAPLLYGDIIDSGRTRLYTAPSCF